jgi:hypothetical protein
MALKEQIEKLNFMIGIVNHVPSLAYVHLNIAACAAIHSELCVVNMGKPLFTYKSI